MWSSSPGPIALSPLASPRKRGKWTPQLNCSQFPAVAQTARAPSSPSHRLLGTLRAAPDCWLPPSAPAAVPPSSSPASRPPSPSPATCLCWNHDAGTRPRLKPHRSSPTALSPAAARTNFPAKAVSYASPFRTASPTSPKEVGRRHRRALSDPARAKAIGVKTKALVAACEKTPGMRCTVSRPSIGGLQYVLIGKPSS